MKCLFYGCGKEFRQFRSTDRFCSFKCAREAEKHGKSKVEGIRDRQDSECGGKSNGKRVEVRKGIRKAPSKKQAQVNAQEIVDAIQRRRIEQEAFILGCRDHKWKRNGHGFECTICGFYTGTMNELNDIIRAEMSEGYMTIKEFCSKKGFSRQWLWLNREKYDWLKTNGVGTLVREKVIV